MDKKDSTIYFKDHKQCREQFKRMIHWKWKQNVSNESKMLVHHSSETYV